MRITRIDIEGKTGRYATISRKDGSRWIEIEILTPEKEFEMNVSAGDCGKQWLVAIKLQRELDAAEGTSSTIGDYYNAIRRLAD